jgi:dihydrofolate synthase/folylpolyglutamate synthase
MFPNANPPSSDRREAALQFLVGRIDYERTLSMPCSEEAFKLDRMRALLHRRGNPQNGLPIIHVAGTKGKGSTSAMIAAILTSAGFKTGLFTSPHIDRVEERIAVDAQPCSGEELADLVELVRPEVEAMDREAEGGPSWGGILTPTPTSATPTMGPTYFEIVTALALCHFVRCGANAAVLEVGLGGRLDSTNVCTPQVSVIASISFDHTKQLGETLAAIAGEKAGIIKPGVPVVSGVSAEEPREVIRRIARQNACRLVELGVDFDFQYHPPRHLEKGPSPAYFDYIKPRPLVVEYPAITDRGFMDMSLGLLGRHQAANASVALAAVEELRRSGWPIPEAAIRRGLAEVVWPARVEVVTRSPTVVLDAAHNAASIAALVEVLEESFSARQRLLVFATTQEKDVRGMLELLLARFDRVIFTRYINNPRGVPPEELLTLATSLGGSSACWGGSSTSWGGSLTATPTTITSPLSLGESQGVEKLSPLPLGEGPGVRAANMEIASSPSDAWSAVHRLAKPDDLICITGSFFLASEMRREIAARPFSQQ